jgi:hypothetical protein
VAAPRRMGPSAAPSPRERLARRRGGGSLWDLLQDTQQAAAITNHQTKQEAALW